MVKTRSILGILMIITVMGTLTGSTIAATTVKEPLIEKTNELASYLDEELLAYYVMNLKKPGQPFLGQGAVKGATRVFPGEAGIYAFAIENLMAIPALQQYYISLGDTKGNQYAEEVLNNIVNMFSGASAIEGITHDTSGNYDNIRYTFEQFVAIDTLSQYYKMTGNGIAYIKAKGIYDVLKLYKSNDTAGYYGREGGYWTAFKGYYKYTDPLNPNNPYYLYCLTNTSLMAAAALARFADAVTDNADNVGGELKKGAIQQAIEAFAFAETLAKYGIFYIDYSLEDATGLTKYYSRTQVFALYALAELYRATGNGMYLASADRLLRNILTYFWDSAYGGLYSSISIIYMMPIDEYDTVKSGYTNALFAFACTELYQLTHNHYYMDIAMGTMNFMYNFLWLSEGTDIAGYTEWIWRNGTRMVPPYYHSLEPEIRLIKTNMLAMQVNALIAYDIKPWYEKYMMELLIGGAVLIAVIMTIILVIKKRRAGRALPKIVKGLLGSED